ncbi:MAG: hypothetical protein HOE69_00255 [Euryarchaeota archaeon]|jgi:hypothetical protein|nr:hypothetical protein [Euryarchaeota archaeon]
MDDPVKVLNQLRNYVTDGRLEIAEHMVDELTTMLLSEKKRTLQRQEILVLALRDYANILEIRNKWKLSLKAAKKLGTESSTLRKMKVKEKVVGNDADAKIIIEDCMQIGRIHIQLGNLKKALNNFSMPAKQGHVEAHVLSIEAYEVCKGSLKKAGKVAKKLVAALTKVGPVNRENNEFILISNNGMTTSVDKIVTCIQRWIQPTSGLNHAIASSLNERLQSLQKQIAAIESGEQAANARLQTAIDSLQPVVDYHEYSQSSR